MRTQTFLIKSDNDRECVMRLPTNRYGGITTKGFKLVRQRFSTPTQPHNLKYALNLEAFSDSACLIDAIKSYQKNII